MKYQLMTRRKSRFDYIVFQKNLKNKRSYIFTSTLGQQGKEAIPTLLLTRLILKMWNETESNTRLKIEKYEN